MEFVIVGDRKVTYIISLLFVVVVVVVCGKCGSIYPVLLFNSGNRFLQPQEKAPNCKRYTYDGGHGQTQTEAKIDDEQNG